MATPLDGTTCLTSTDAGVRDACVLGQIGRLLKNADANADQPASADLFVPADQIDITASISPSPTWTYSGLSTTVCNNANTNWLGVRCGQVGGTGAYRVLSVDLQSVGLRGFKPISGTIPTLFAMLTALTYLNLANNKLAGSLPVFTPAGGVAYVPTAFQSKEILGIPTTLTTFNVTGNRLGLTVSAAGVKSAIATPLTVNVITNLAAMRTGGSPAYALTHVDLSSNCLQGTIATEISQITVGASALFRAFNMSGNSGIDGSKPLCGNSSTRADCDGSFNNKFACADDYFVDYGGQTSAATGAAATSDTPEQATLRFTGPLTTGQRITVGDGTNDLVFTSGTAGTTAAQLAAAFSNIKKDQTPANINTQNGLSAATQGEFSQAGTQTFTSRYTTGPVIASNAVVATSVTNGDVTPNLDTTIKGNGPTGTPANGPIPAEVTITQGVASKTESATVTFKDLSATQSVTVDGLTLTAVQNMNAAEVAAAFGVATIQVAQALASPKKGQFTGKLTGFKPGTAAGSAVVFTATKENQDVTNLAATQGSPTIGTPTQGAAGATNQQVVTFNAIAGASTVIVAGLTFTAGGAATDSTPATYIANAFANLGVGNTDTEANSQNQLTTGAGKGTFTAGPLAGFSTSAANGAAVTFTSATQNAVGTALTVNGGTGTAPTVTNTAGSAGATEKVTVTFTAVTKGSSVAIAGLVYSVAADAAGDATAANVAAAFATLEAGITAEAANALNSLFAASAGSPGKFTSGTLVGWRTGAATGTPATAVEFTADAGGVNIANLTPSSSVAASTPTVTNVDGAPTVLETAVFRFNGQLPNTGTVTIAGQTFTTAGATAVASPTQIAAAFENRVPGAIAACPAALPGASYTCAGTLAGFQSSKATGDTITYTPVGTGASGNPTDITYRGTLYAPVQATVANGAKATAETASLQFRAIQGGQSVTVAGLTYRPTADATATAVADAFANLNAGASSGPSTSLGTYSGTFTNYKTGAVTGTDTVVATSTLLGNVENLSPTSTATVSDTVTVKSATPATPDAGTTAQQAAEGIIERWTATFKSGLAAGQGFTLAGLVLTNRAGAATMTAQEVANAYANLKPAAAAEIANPLRAAWTGALTRYCTGPATATDPPVVTFTACVDNDDVANLETTNTATNNAQTLPLVPTNKQTSQGTLTPTTKQGGTGVTEKADVTFVTLTEGTSITLAGLTYTAKTGGSSATATAAAWANLGYGTTAAIANALNPPNGVFSGGPLTDWSTGTAAGALVPFTSRTIAADVTNLAQTAGPTLTIAPNPQGSAASATGANPETATVNFAALTAGQFASAGGLTYKSTDASTANEVAAAFANLVPGATSGPGVTTGTYQGVLGGWSTSASNGAAVTFTASAIGRNQDDLAAAAVAGSPTDVVPTVARLPAGANAATGDGKVPLQERSVVTFANLAANQIITIAGLAFKVGTAGATAAQLGDVYAGLVAGTTAEQANARTVNGATLTEAAQGKFVAGTTLTGWTTSQAAANGGAVTFAYTGAAPGTAVADLVPTGTGFVTITSTVTAGADGSYPYALVCGGNQYYVNYYMYEGCVLNQIRRALDPGVGTPAVQNNTALLTWMGDRACPSKNAVPWTGVSCDTNDRVTGISLSGQKITGTMPLDFFFLANLKTLDLSNNRIGGTFPTGTYQRWINARGEAVTTTISPIPTALETFNIANNRISGGLDVTAGSAIVSATRRNINLSNNCLLGPLPNTLTGVASGVTLNLNGNRGKTGTDAEALCPAATPAAVLAVCNNRFSNELACRDYAGVPTCDGVTYDNYQGYEGCLLKRIGTALGANLASLGWTSAGPCLPNATAWTGVACDSNSTDATGIRDRVVRIDLSGRGLTGSIPFDIFYLSALQELNLANNTLRGTLPTQNVTINGATVTAFPFPTTIRRVFLQGNALTGPLNAALPAFFDLGRAANGSLVLTDFNVNNNCLSGPLASAFDAFIPRVTRVSFNGNQGLCTGVTTATTLAVCDSSSVNAAVCSGTGNPSSPSSTTPTTLPPFSILVTARFAVNPSIFNDAALLEALRCETAELKFRLPCAWVQIVAGYIYDTTVGAIISRALGSSQKAVTQELQSVIQFRIFADNAAAATAALNNFINNPSTGRFPAVAGTISTNDPVLPPTPPGAPRVPAVPTQPTAPVAPFAPFAPRTDGDDDGWKIGVGVGVGVGGFLLLVIIICIVVFCLKKKAAPLPQEIDYNKVAVVQQGGVPGAYPVYPQGAYPVYPQGAYAVSAPPPTPAYTYAVAA